MKQPYEFTIERGAEKLRVKGRGAAVRRARDLSQKSHRPVRVQREDNKMTMTWRRGVLQEYRLETR